MIYSEKQFKDSSNSCKPSSTNRFKKVIQNNRVKSGRKKGHKRSAPTVSQNPDETIRVSKVATCPCCNKEYSPKFPDNLKSIINYDEKIKSLLVYLNTYCNVPNQKCT